MNANELERRWDWQNKTGDYNPDLWHQAGQYKYRKTEPEKKSSLVMRKHDPTKTWFLTAMHVEVIATHPTGEMKTKRDTRTFGYYKGWNKAYAAVKENRCNMHECLYTYLVMENIGEGVHALCTDEQWFKWTGKRWKDCRKPAWAKGMTNWALG